MLFFNFISKSAINSGVQVGFKSSVADSTGGDIGVVNFINKISSAFV